jgi:hypothetical protein
MPELLYVRVGLEIFIQQCQDNLPPKPLQSHNCSDPLRRVASDRGGWGGVEVDHGCEMEPPFLLSCHKVLPYDYHMVAYW